MEEHSNNPRLLAVGVAIAFISGYFIGDDSRDVARLKRDLLNAQSKSAEARMQTPVPQKLPGPAKAKEASKVQPTKAVSVQELANQRRALISSNLVSRTASSDDEEYSTLFSTLGLDDAEVAHFKSNLVALHHRAIEAGGATEQLLQERYKYDKDVRAALGEENYRTYRTFEESKPALREYAQIQDFAKTTDNELDASRATEVVQLIKDVGATTTTTWHGPYDPPPQPVVGQEACLKQLSRTLTELETKTGMLLERAREQNLPADQIRLLTEYYASKAREDKLALDVIARPLDEDTRATHEFIDEQITKARGKTQ